MIELLQAQLDLAAAMSRATSGAQRNAWQRYYAAVNDQLERLQRPPRVRPRPPPIPTRP